jgi:glutamate N-acetyltransferase/amino-acid N-acetyltransferase
MSYSLNAQAKSAVTYPQGFLAGGMVCGLKASGRPDLGLLLSQGEHVKCFGAFTRSSFAAAPVLVTQELLGSGSSVRGIVVNSGNANACTGQKGLASAQKMSQLAAQLCGQSVDFAVCSTGVIGVELDIAKVEAGLKVLAPQLSPEGGENFSNAILTTDTIDKQVTAEVVTSAGTIRMGGCSKGAGMIHPDMATMLAFVTTDLGLDDSFKAEFLQIVDDSFNSITVDGDTSTNDTVLLLANGLSGVRYEDLGIDDKAAVRNALFEVFAELAKKIIRDGEGATKFVHLTVSGAVDREIARTYARHIANSKLVKTALFGKDPNWGRLVASLGAIAKDLDTTGVDLRYGPYLLVQAGQPVEVDRAALKEVAEAAEIEIELSLGQGHASSTVWTCDLSYDYVKINAEYTT